MKLIMICLISLICQVQIADSQTDTISAHYLLKFSNYMDLVSRNNLEYAAEKFEVSKAEAAIEIAKVFPDPTLSFGLTQDKENHQNSGQGFSSELGTTLELFGKRRARIDLARSEHELAKALLTDFFRNLQAESASVFLEALKQKQLFAVKVNSYETMKRLSEADSIRLKLGSIMEIDAIQSKLEAGSLLNEVLQAEADLKNADTQLSQMTGSLAADTLWTPDGSLLFKQRSFVLSDLITAARNNRADLVAALFNKEVANKALKLAYKERNIDLDLKLGIANDYPTASNGPTATTISGGIAIPLKFSNYYRGSIKMAQFQISQSEELYKKAELQIQIEITQAMQRYQALCKQVDSYDHGMLESAQNVRKGKIYSYNRGETSLLEVLNAQRTYNDVQQSYYETLYNRAVALVELEKAAGIWDISF
ncbi:MAG TPA: TolC family protein [Prolixibacteraceae bacterium]|jgi:cobalt-zinc-cadmium efflux system outer membrane protein